MHVLLLLYMCFYVLRSHSQATGGDQANAIYLELKRMGFKAWCECDPFAHLLISLML